MKKIIALVLAALIFCLSACSSGKLEKSVSFEEHEAVTIKYVYDNKVSESEGVLAYKKTDKGFVFYEMTSGGTEYVCETEGSGCASFIRAENSEEFLYQQVNFDEGSGFSDDAAYYRYSFACYGFDYEKELGELTFENVGETTISGRDCYIYGFTLEGSDVSICVDKETGIWMCWEEGGASYTVKEFSFDANVIPVYRAQAEIM